mgnify:CR=1 FL=1
MSAVQELRTQIDAARALVAAFQNILGDDAEAKADLVEGETGLYEALRAGLARIVELRALVAANEHIQDDLRARLKRFGDQEERIRAAMLTAMEVGGLPRLETPLGTVSRRALAPTLVITDETQIPEPFWRNEPKLNRMALLAALRIGDQIPGASLSNGGATVALKFT